MTVGPGVSYLLGLGVRVVPNLILAARYNIGEIQVGGENSGGAVSSNPYYNQLSLGIKVLHQIQKNELRFGAYWIKGALVGGECSSDFERQNSGQIVAFCSGDDVVELDEDRMEWSGYAIEGEYQRRFNQDWAGNINFGIANRGTKILSEVAGLSITDITPFVMSSM